MYDRLRYNCGSQNVSLHVQGHPQNVFKHVAYILILGTSTPSPKRVVILQHCGYAMACLKIHDSEFVLIRHIIPNTSKYCLICFAITSIIPDNLSIEMEPSLQGNIHKSI